MMADDRAARSKDEHKLLSKHRWRGKIFKDDSSPSKPRKSTEETNQAIDDFLHTAPQVSTSRPSIEISNPRPRPQLDTKAAPRWPSVEQVNGLASSNPSSRPTSSRSRGSSPRRPRKGKGLRVNFTARQPEIIGEGGDEAELPPFEVSRPRAQLQVAPDQAAPKPGSRPHSIERKPLPQQSTGASFEPPAFKRRPTGFEQVPGGHAAAAALADYDSDDDGQGISGLSLTESPQDHRTASSDFAARVQRKLAEEGMALHQAARAPPSPEAPSQTQSKSNTTTDQPPPYMFDPSIMNALDDIAVTPTYSVRPTPSPQPSHSYFPQTSRSGHLQTPTSAVPQSAASSTFEETPRSAYPTDSRGEQRNNTQGSIHDVTLAVGDQALDEFSARVQHYSPVFHIAAEHTKPIMETPFIEWIRAASWFFLKGRGNLESAMRSRPQGAQPKIPIQAYVDLAKAWWIVQQIAAQHPELRRYGNVPMSQMIDICRSYEDESMASAIETHQSIVTSFRALAMSLKRNDILPPPQEQSQLAPGLDTTIWIKYPLFTPEICSLLSGTSSKSLVLQAPRLGTSVGDTLPLADTKTNFSCSRFFVDAFLSSGSDESADFHLPCVLSVLRERTDWQLNAVLASQSDLVSVRIKADAKSGISWEDVRWRSRQSSLIIDLQRNLSLTIQLSERDYGIFWNLYESTNKIEESLHPEPGEVLLYEDVLRSFRVLGEAGQTSGFPREPLRRCRVKLFEKRVTLSEGTGTRKAHRNFRLLVISSPKTKSLHRISRELGGKSCILFGFLRGAEGDPGLLLKLTDKSSPVSFVLSFQQDSERAHLYSLLTGSFAQGEEMTYADLPLAGLSVEPHSQAENISTLNHDVWKGLGWDQITVVNKDPENPEHDYGQTVLSESLRIISNAKGGTLTDRINLGPGQLHIGLAASSSPELSILCSAQEDLTLCLAENEVSKSDAAKLAELMKAVHTNSFLHVYRFRSFEDLHVFQGAITGFTVIFDGLATSFAIARRRMVVPLYKKWDSPLTRIQIVSRAATGRQQPLIQLVAFFAPGFSHGHCMAFVLKGTDVFEGFSRSGKYCVRAVDAKFCLPRMPGDKNENGGARSGAGDGEGRFICLDLPEYPAEHDDITIAFDSQADRDKFQEALPAPVTPVSRMPSLRK